MYSGATLYSVFLKKTYPDIKKDSLSLLYQKNNKDIHLFYSRYEGMLNTDYY